MPPRPPTVHRVLHNLWIRGRTNHISLDAKRDLAVSLRLAAVVALCPRPDPSWNDVPGVTYHHWPMPDGALVPDSLQEHADYLAGLIDAGSGVLVYCNAGRNRSALLAGLVAYRVVGGCTGDFVVDLLRSARPGSLANPAFAQHLQALA